MALKRRPLLIRSALVAAGATLGVPGCGAPPLETQPTTPQETPAGVDVHIELRAVVDQVAVRPGAPTRVWRYRGRLLRGDAGALETLPGTYLGPTIRVRRGQRVRIDFINELPESTMPSTTISPVAWTVMPCTTSPVTWTLPSK